MRCWTAANALAPIADVRFLKQLKALPETGNVKVRRRDRPGGDEDRHPSGAIIVGGKGPNTYDLDRMRNVAAVIDLGGGNTYYEGSVGLDRPVLLVITLGGNNTFPAASPAFKAARSSASRCC